MTGGAKNFKNKNTFNPDGTLTCRICKEDKAVNNFYRNKIVSTGYEKVCKPCAREKAMAWRSGHVQNRSAVSAEVSSAKRAKRAMATYETDLAKGWRLRLLEFYENKCLKCGSQKNLHADHVLPLSRGGGHFANNMQVLCRTCNISKHTNFADYRAGKLFKENTPSE